MGVFTADSRLDPFSTLIGMAATVLCSFPSVMRFQVSGATRLVFRIQFVFVRGHSDGVQYKTVHRRLSILFFLIPALFEK